MKNTCDNIYDTNKAIVAGLVKTPLKFSHKTFGESFYTFVLGIERRSGYVDEINVMISERLIYDCEPEIDDFVEITGQVRTYKENIDGKNRCKLVNSKGDDLIPYERGFEDFGE